MSHDLTIINGTASMAFTGTTPWHGLGQRLTDGATIAEWTRAAGMDWEALTATPHFTRADGTVGTMPGGQLIYRSDTGDALSVMSKQYKIVQPREVLGFFQDLIGKDFKLHTAGVLNGGRRMWALAKNGHSGDIVKGDKAHQFLMLATSLDGSTPTTAAFTAVRVVCANTIAIALTAAQRDINRQRAAVRRGEATDIKAVRVSHKSVFNASDVHEQLGLADVAWRVFTEATRKMADTPCTSEQARDILRGIFGMPVQAKRSKAAETAAQAIASAQATSAAKLGGMVGQTLADLLAGTTHTPKEDAESDAREELARLLANGDVREQKSVARCLELFAGKGRGADHPGVAGTQWGLFNAITEHVDHEQGTSTDTRLTSAWFGRGAQFKQAAFDALAG